ncbi:FIMAH domain-containing protein [Paenibacillus allorhizosphaerae]|uniref:FIMAH domain-containing protein n=1 Tax=Paenibacillus allorhizosphaerae TaxID=2849866 RepID=A0ABM8VSZ8_9BACL|nr:hypothetical protein [Paenibacillus allorhizosphaerae]CAG7656945.1 hypothetical protein PAECIP111802_06570 [Paenibacillus allorhizosphaerae]
MWRTRPFMFALLAILLTVVSGMVPLQRAHADDKMPNLIANPGFELPLEEDGSIPGWSLYGGTGAIKPGITVEVNDRFSSSGGSSLYVADTATNASIVVYSDPIDVTAGNKYSFHVKTNNTSGTIYAAVRYYKSASDNVVTGYIAPASLAALKPVTAWSDVSTESQAPAAATIARILVYTASSSVGQTYVDDLSFTVKPQDGGTIPYEISNIGPQIHTVNTHRAAFGKDGAGNLLAYSTLVGNPASLLVVDVKTEKLIAQIPVSEKVGGTTYASTYVRGLSVQPDGTVYLAGTPSYLFKYVPGADKVQFIRKAAGSQTFDMKNGPEGTLIGGTYNKSEAFEYSIASNQLKNLGSIMPDEAYTYSVAYDEERRSYYFGIGSHAHLIKYNVDTGEKVEIPLPAKFGSAEFIFDMTVSGGKLFMRFSPGGTVAMDLATQQFDETTGTVTSRLVSPKSPVDNKVYYTTSSRLGYYDLDLGTYQSLNLYTDGDAYGFTFAQLGEADFPGYSLVGFTREGRIFKYNLSTGKIKYTIIPVEGEPTALQTVEKTTYGNISTSGYLSGGNAIYDPFTGVITEYTNESLGLGQKLPATQTDRIYSHKGKLYFAAYPNAKVFEFDPNKPWNVKDPVQLNPKLLFSAYDVGQQDRALAGTIIGGQDKIVVGTVPDYGLLGGALVIYDLNTRTREAYLNVVDRQSVTAVTYKDGFIYGGTGIWGGLGQDPIATEAKLFIWDIEKKQKVLEMTPVPGKKAITELIVGPDGNIWGSDEDTLFIFNPDTRQVVHTQQISTKSYSSAVWRDAQFTIGTDGNVYGVQANRFFTINAATKQLTVIRDAGLRNWMTQDDFGHFYLTEETNLLKLSIPALVLKPIGAQLNVSQTELQRGQSADVTIQGLLEKGRVVEGLEQRNPVFRSSNPSVVDFVYGKPTAINPGTSDIWAEVTINGTAYTTNRVTLSVDVTLPSLQSELDFYIGSSEIERSLAVQLTTSLKQVQHFTDKGDRGQAAKHLDDFIKHLSGKAMSVKASSKALSVLLSDAAALKASYQS